MKPNSSATDSPTPQLEFDPPPTKSFSCAVETQLADDKLSSKESCDFTHEVPERAIAAWKPSVFKIRALVGLASVGISVLCLFASFGVLAGSDKRPYNSWAFAPTVYLAITTAISNTALGCALAQAAPISWWNKAYRGSTIRELELQWEAGQSFVRAILHGLWWRRRLNLLTLASLAVALVVIDGPLLQKASSVGPRTHVSNVTLHLSIAPEIPRGYSGRMQTNNTGFEFDRVDTIIDDWWKGSPITLSTNCQGTCSTTVKAPGIQVGKCINSSWPITNAELHSNTSAWGGGGYLSARPLLFAGFSTESTLIPGWQNQRPEPSGPAFKTQDSGPEQNVLVVGRATTGGNRTTGVCHGEWSITYCQIMSAIVEHNVTITGNTIDFTNGPGAGRVLARADNTALNLNPPPNHKSPTELVEILSPLNPYMIVSPLQPDDSSLQLIQSLLKSINASFNANPVNHTFSYPDLYTFSGQSRQYLKGADGCSIITEDPYSDLIGKLNSVLLRVGVDSATLQDVDALLDSGLTVNQTVRAIQTDEFNVYRTDFRWFAGAATLQIMCIILVLPAFYGWWRIGIEMSLSPFQIANLFDAPMFRDVHSASGASGIVQAMGDKKLKLGVVYDRLARACDLDSRSMDAPDPARMGLYDPEAVAPLYKGIRLTD